MFQKSKRAFKTILIVCSVVISTFSNAGIVRIKKSCVLTPASIGAIDLLHSEDGFSVVKDGEMSFVEDCWVDSYLKNISYDRLKNFLGFGKIFVNQMDNGEFSIKAKVPVKGGGIFGANAGFFFGKTLVYGVGYGAIWGVSLFAGPGAPVAASVMTAYLAAPIEGLSNVVGLGCGVAGAVASGPV